MFFDRLSQKPELSEMIELAMGGDHWGENEALAKAERYFIPGTLDDNLQLLRFYHLAMLYASSQVAQSRGYRAWITWMRRKWSAKRRIGKLMKVIAPELEEDAKGWFNPRLTPEDLLVLSFCGNLGYFPYAYIQKLLRSSVYAKVSQPGIRASSYAYRATTLAEKGHFDLAKFDIEAADQIVVQDTSLSSFFRIFVKEQRANIHICRAELQEARTLLEQCSAEALRARLTLYHIILQGKLRKLVQMIEP